MPKILSTAWTVVEQYATKAKAATHARHLRKAGLAARVKKTPAGFFQAQIHRRR